MEPVFISTVYKVEVVERTLSEGYYNIEARPCHKSKETNCFYYFETVKTRLDIFQIMSNNLD